MITRGSRSVANATPASSEIVSAVSVASRYAAANEDTPSGECATPTGPTALAASASTTEFNDPFVKATSAN